MEKEETGLHNESWKTQMYCVYFERLKFGIWRLEGGEVKSVEIEDCKAMKV
jgi:hypothetical protein